MQKAQSFNIAETCQLRLNSGWYVFSGGHNSSALLELYDNEAFQLIELSASHSAGMYAWLPAGIYRVRPVYPARCASRHPVSLKRLPVPELVKLLMTRFLTSVKSGASFQQLSSKIHKVFNPNGALGVRHNSYEENAFLGPLARDELHRSYAQLGANAYQERLKKLVKKPHIYVMGRNGPIDPKQLKKHNLHIQIYSNFSIKDNTNIKYNLIIEPTDILTEDAILLFVEAINSHPEWEKITSNKWVNGKPTTLVSFDPLLYQNALPTPYLEKRRGILPNKETWETQRPHYGLINTPLAHSNVTHRYIYTPPPPPINIKPLVSIIIPTRDRSELLETCLDSLLKTEYSPYEVIIIDNGSVEPQTLLLFQKCRTKGIRILRDAGDFNYSRLCNLGASNALGEYIIFLNNDIILTHPDWMSLIISYAALPDAGAIGGKLWYKDKSLQHGGIALGMTQLSGHLWRGLPHDAQAHEPRLNYPSLRSAITGALMCIARHKFEAVGGFEETLFPVTLNDVDLCLKLKTKNWYSIFVPAIVAYHLEAKSRGDDNTPLKRSRRLNELRAFQNRWAAEIDNDPWLPDTIMRSTEQYNLR